MDDSPWCPPGACATCDGARRPGPSAEARAELAEADARGKHRGLELALGVEGASWDAMLRMVAALARGAAVLSDRDLQLLRGIREDASSWQQSHEERALLDRLLASRGRDG